jgi:hypothetical protein
LDSRSHARRFSMHVGGNVVEGFPRAEEVNKMQTNIFASGFENGLRISIGASLKGRIWSHRVAKSLRQWFSWCNAIGSKLLDERSDIDSIMRSFIRPVLLAGRPQGVFLAAEWSWELFQSTSEAITLEMDGVESPIVDADLVITTFEPSGPVCFNVVTPDWSATYEVQFNEKGMVYTPRTAEPTVRSRNPAIRLSSFLQQVGITFHLANDSLVIHPGILLRPDRTLAPYDGRSITTLDWSGVNLRKESRGKERAADSIQARMLEQLKTDSNWRIIIDDDGKGEVADIVALSATDRDLRMRIRSVDPVLEQAGA